MRFEVTNVLDAIEARLTTDVTLAQAVVDLAEIARFVELDGGKRVNLLRTGMVLDALARLLSDGGAMLYAVAGRDLRADQDLTSKERMVLGRWSDDGRIEAVNVVGDRAVEVADLTGLPVIGRGDFGALANRYRWLSHEPDRVLSIVPHDGGADLRSRSGRPPLGFGIPDEHGRRLMSRLWQCGDFDCPSFGPRRAANQPVPRLRGGTPTCPRHDAPLADGGPRPPSVPMMAIIDGLPRLHFSVNVGGPAVVGRAPDEPDGGVAVGPWLQGEAIRWISRTHLYLDLRDGAPQVTDSSTNGTVIQTRTAPDAQPRSVRIGRNQTYRLGEWDTIELYQGVEICRADRPRMRPQAGEVVGSVLTDAPTVAIRLPGRA